MSEATNTNERVLMRAERNPVVLGDNITLATEGSTLVFNGPKGSLSYTVHPHVGVRNEDGTMYFSLLNPKSRSQVGTTRARIVNIIEGLTKGFEKKLQLVGVGYKVKLDGSNKLVLNLGKSHPDTYTLPETVKVQVPSQTEIVLTSIDKVVLGQVAAEIRAFRPPEPYKGKGVRYANEVISLKEVKKQ